MYVARSEVKPRTREGSKAKAKHEIAVVLKGVVTLGIV
jgi:hypothetical protein